MYLYNIKQEPGASSVYILDRRNWKNRDMLKEGYKSETAVELNYLLNKAFLKTPHIKEVVVSSLSYQDFITDVQRKKSELSVMFKLIDDDNQKTIIELLQSYNCVYPRFFLFTLDLPFSKDISEPLKDKIKNFYIRLKLNRGFVSKTLLFTEEKSIDNILIAADKVLANKSKYLPGNIYQI